MTSSSIGRNMPCIYQQIRNISSATAGITKAHRLYYCRRYPTIVVQQDGSTINVPYHEPRQIIQVVSKVIKFHLLKL